MSESTATPTIYALARDTLAECGRDPAKATDKLCERLSNDRALLNAIVRDAVNASVKYEVLHVVRGDRESLFRAAAVDIARARAGAEAFVRATALCLLDMPLPIGKRLRDAMRGEIEDCANRYDKVSVTTGCRAAWLHRIARLVPEGKRCGDVMTDARAAQLYELVLDEFGGAIEMTKPIGRAPRQVTARSQRGFETQQTSAACRAK